MVTVFAEDENKEIMRTKVGEKVGEKLSENQMLIIDCMQKDPFISANSLAKQVGISVRKIETNISKLKEAGHIKRIGPAKGGQWQIIQK